MMAEWPVPQCKLIRMLSINIDNYNYQYNNYKKVSLNFIRSKIEREIL